MGRTVTLDNSMLAQLAVNPAVANAFPFIAAPVKQFTVGAPCCTGKSTPVSWDPIKLGIMGLPPERLGVFKQLINADTIVIYVNGTSRSL